MTTDESRRFANTDLRHACDVETYFAASSSSLWHILSLVQCVLSLVVFGFINYLLLIHAVLYCYNITTLEYSRAKRQGRLRFFFFYKRPQVSPTSDEP